MSTLHIRLTTTPSAQYWNTGTELSFDEQGAVIHLPEDGNYPLHAIRRAARKISGLATKVALQGKWDFEQQWAFYTSFEEPGKSNELQWAEGSDIETLNSHKICHQFTCDLINATPEDISPEALATRVAAWLSNLAPEAISHRQIVGEALLEAKWHGIYQVGRGSSRPPVLLEVDFNPTGNDAEPVENALVGKGITFDSGGYSIKSSEGMLTMKCDMGGAATVAGALGLAIKNGLQKRTKLYLCCAENLISGHAYKLGDVITYKNGVSVEIVNTDAEGRLVLADGLMAATESGAKTIIDAATLTGAAVTAVGSEYNALFALDETLRNRALEAATSSNEPAWPLPLEPWHQYQCPSAFADTANSRPQKGGGAGGASNAAGFLSRFVGNDGKGWLHIDLAAAYHQNGTAMRPIGASAQGIRTIAKLIAH